MSDGELVKLNYCVNFDMFCYEIDKDCDKCIEEENEWTKKWVVWHEGKEK